MSMKIGMYCSEYPPRQHGGIGTFVEVMAQAYLAAGHEVVVVEFGVEGGEREQDGVTVVTLPLPPRVRGLTDLRIRWRLRRWCDVAARAGRIEVMEIPDFDGMLPFAPWRCPVVVRLHLSRTVVASELGTGVGGKARFLERRTLVANPYWIGVSRHILEGTERVFGVRAQESEVVYNPVAVPAVIDDGAVRELGEGRFVLFAGYVGERKGALLLAEAARGVLSRHPEVRLVYAGKEDEIGGEMASAVILRLVGAELAGRVHFTGAVPRGRVAGLMRAAAVVCLPSRSESFGLVPVEAMLLGRPVIYTTTGPGPELIEDGVTGYLCDPADAGSLEKCLEEVLGDPEGAAEVGERGREAALERFSAGQCVEESVRFFRRVAGR